jgi:ParB family chromosome partitioning protein
MTEESETENIKFDNIEIQDIPLSQLSVDSSQPRKHIDKAELDDLIESIKEKGLLYPVIFRIDEKNKKILVSGERRFKAFKALKKVTIPAMLINNAKYDEIALIDNIQRVGLHPIDEAEAVTNLMNKYKYTQDQLGNLVGKAQNTISDISQLMELTLEIREDARKRKKLSRSALLKIARIKKPELQQKAYDTLIAALSTHKEKKTRTKLSSSTKAITFVDNGLKVIKKLDFNSLGEEKAEVITKLEELLQEIQGKLDSMKG